MDKKHLSFMTSRTRLEMTGEVVKPNNVSIRSKCYKSPAHKAKAKSRLEANRELRAELHSAKSFETNCEKRASIQAKIDAIGAGEQTNG